MTMLRAVLRWGYDRVCHWPPLLGLRFVPEFRRFHGHWPNLIRPRTFNEKVLTRMLFDRRRILGVFAGKYESRQYVADRGLPELLVPLVGLVRDPADLRTMALPRGFMAKMNHGSSFSRIYRDWDGSKLAELEALAAKWIAIDYGKYGGEWAYRHAERMVVVETLLESRGDLPHDYKFWCCDGRVAFFNFSPEVLREGTRNVFDRDMNWLPVDYITARGLVEPALSPRTAAMIDAAERLSAGMDFVRVDLLDADDRFWFGEITPYPNAGFNGFTPRSWDRTFGDAWTMPGWRTLRSGGPPPRRS